MLYGRMRFPNPPCASKHAAIYAFWVIEPVTYPRIEMTTEDRLSNAVAAPCLLAAILLVQNCGGERMKALRQFKAP